MCPTSFPWWAIPLGVIVGLVSASMVYKRFGTRGLLYMMPLVMVGALWAYSYIHGLQARGC